MSSFKSSQENLGLENEIFYYNSEWDKLLLLLWKNIRLLWSNKLPFFLTILSPLIFCSILIGLRITTDTEKLPKQKYPLLHLKNYWDHLLKIVDERKTFMDSKIEGFTFSPFIPQKLLGYAPKTNATYNIMLGSLRYLGSTPLKGFETCQQLRKAIIKENLMAGVCFDLDFRGYEKHDIYEETTHKVHTTSIYPKYLKYTLIYPFAVRQYKDSFIGAGWHTHSLYLSFNRTDQRNREIVDGGYVGYIREGFAALQNSISLSYLKILSDIIKPDFKLPVIVMQRYPSNKYLKDPLLETVDFSLSLMILFGNLYPVLTVISNIVKEKQQTNKVLMKMMGVGNYLHFLAWLLESLIRFSIGTLILVTALKINWFSSGAILPSSNFFALLIVLLVYDLSSICFSQMIGSFFKRTTNAISHVVILWFLSYLPYIAALSHFINFPESNYLFTLIFHNTAMGCTIENIMQFEQYGNGFHIVNFFDSELLNNNATVGFYMTVMLIQSLAYTCISFYVEELRPGFYGLPKRWNFLFSYQKGSNLLGFGLSRQRFLSTESETSVELNTRRHTPFIFEIAGQSMVTVNVQSLTKVYDSQTVVNNVNMQLHDNEITILIGHNGCGKTTLLSMISGLVPATSGNITIEGFDIRKDQRYAYSSLGISLGENVLFENLTVEDQLRFFAYLKSIHTKSVESEVERYLQATKLSEVRHVLTRDLSSGLKQQLSVCCALAGQSRVVLLDEPGSFMDLPARHRIYNLLDNERNKRTILISSTSLEIVDSLADRVLIMSNGELQCDGTPIFLKKMYGEGYRLILGKNLFCNVGNVTALIRKYIPNISPACTLGNELIYIIEEIHLDKCDEITQDLQANMNTLDIETVALRSVNMEDIFYKLGLQYPSQENRFRLIEIMNGITYYPAENKNLLFMDIKDRTEGWPALRQKLKTLFWKRLLYSINNKFSFFMQLFAPSLFTVYVLGLKLYKGSLKKMPIFDVLLDRYRHSATVIDTRPRVQMNVITLADRYKEMIFWMGLNHKLEEVAENELFADYILDQLDKSPMRLDHLHHIGVTFNDRYMIGWFNNIDLHSVPLSLNLMHMALLRTINNNDEESGIYVSLEPLNNMENYMDGLLGSTINNANTLAICLALAMAAVSNYNIFIIIHELKSGFRRMQKTAGVNFGLYWSVNAAYDFALIFFMSCLTVGSISLLQQDLNISKYIYVFYFFILIITGICLYSWSYVIAILYPRPTQAFGLALFFQTFGIIGFCHFVESHGRGFISSSKNPMTIYFVWLPMYALCSAISTTYHHAEVLRACADKNIRQISIYLEECKVLPNCCYEYKLLSFKDGIIIEVLALFIATLIAWLIILFKDCHYIFPLKNIPSDNYYAQLKEHKRRHNDEMESKFGEETAFMEGFMIQIMHNSEKQTVPLICDRLGKFYKKKPIIDRLSLILNRGECFCILGVSGCGLTALLNMLSGTMTPSYGRILIYGQDMNLKSIKYHQIMSYAQQKLITDPEFTVKQLLEMFCKLHSYPPNRVSEICNNLAKALGLFESYHKSIFLLSTGTLSHLNFAVAVMGNPEIFLIDLVSNCMDCSGVRCIWNIMKRMQRKGTVVLYGALNFEECERFATRVGFMSHGRLCLIGTPWGLDKVYAHYHFLTIKFNHGIIQRAVLLSRGSHNYLYAATINKLTDFICSNFQNSVLKEQHGNHLLFLIPINSSTISNIFTTILRNVYFLNIEDFYLSSGTLSLSFLEFWEKNHLL